MDEIIDIIRQKRNVSENTIKTYKTHLSKVMNNIEEKNISGLSNCENIIDMLEKSDYKDVTKRAYLSSLVVCMDAHNMNEQAKKYRKKMLQYLAKEKEQYAKNEMSEKEKTNWATMDELCNHIKTYERKIKNSGLMKKDTITKAEKDFLQQYVVAMLYCGDTANHPPVRLDYSPMLVISEKDYNEKSKNNELPNEMNFLVVKSRNKKLFALHNYKTAKTYGIKKIPLSPKINTAVNKLLKFNKTDYLFENHQGRAMTSNSLGKLLSSAFSPINKNITINLIRHIFVSEKYPVEKTKEQEADAEKMLHSPSTQKIYAKSNE